MENAKNTKPDQFFILRKSRILNGESIYHVSSVWHGICDLIFDYFVSISQTFVYEAYSHFCLHLPAGWIHVGRTAKRPGALSDCATSATTAARCSVAAARAGATAGPW